ncbi:hypothetical protein SUDANB120_05117 [Streptomyces sp. enrichment culture]
MARAGRGRASKAGDAGRGGGGAGRGRGWEAAGRKWGRCSGWGTSVGLGRRWCGGGAAGRWGEAGRRRGGVDSAGRDVDEPRGWGGGWLRWVGGELGSVVGASRQSHRPSGAGRPVKGAPCGRVAARWPSATLDRPPHPGMPKDCREAPGGTGGGTRSLPAEPRPLARRPRRRSLHAPVGWAAAACRFCRAPRIATRFCGVGGCGLSVLPGAPDRYTLPWAGRLRAAGASGRRKSLRGSLWLAACGPSVRPGAPDCCTPRVGGRLRPLAAPDASDRYLPPGEVGVCARRSLRRPRSLRGCRLPGSGGRPRAEVGR